MQLLTRMKLLATLPLFFVGVNVAGSRPVLRGSGLERRNLQSTTADYTCSDDTACDGYRSSGGYLFGGSPGAPRYCCFQNVALNQPASQSSTAYDIAPASNAVDGNTNGIWNWNRNGNSITHTNSEANPWWEVDLGKDYVLFNVQVFNREDCCSDRLHGVIFDFINSNGVTVASWSSDRYFKFSNTLSLFFPDATGWSPTAEQYTARKIRVRLSGSNHVLSLAEVQVYGLEITVPTASPTPTPVPDTPTEVDIDALIAGNLQFGQEILASQPTSLQPADEVEQTQVDIENKANDHPVIILTPQLVAEKEGLIVPDDNDLMLLEKMQVIRNHDRNLREALKHEINTLAVLKSEAKKQLIRIHEADTVGNVLSIVGTVLTFTPLAEIGVPLLVVAAVTTGTSRLELNSISGYEEHQELMSQKIASELEQMIRAMDDFNPPFWVLYNDLEQEDFFAQDGYVDKVQGLWSNIFSPTKTFGSAGYNAARFAESLMQRLRDAAAADFAGLREGGEDLAEVVLPSGTKTKFHMAHNFTRFSPNRNNTRGSPISDFALNRHGIRIFT